MKRMPENGQTFPTVHVHALPVLAIGRTGFQRFGLVVIDRAFRLRHEQVLDLRRRTTDAARLETVARVVGHLVRSQNVATLVFAAATARSRTPANLAESFIEICGREGVTMRETSVARTARELGGDAEDPHLLSELAIAYRELAARLDFRTRSLFRNRDHARRLRPLVDAFILAHAVRLEASRTASRRT